MYRILIADDEALEREGLELMISRMLPGSFSFFHAENGRRAIQIAEEHRPDFIFMDIKMPGIHGLEAIHEIKARLPDARIVMVTAHDYFAYAREAMSLGVKEYVLKPAKREDMLQILNRLMAELEQERRKRQAELAMKETLSRLLPLAENELTVTLMTEYVQETDLRELMDILQLEWEKGYSVVLSCSRSDREVRELFQAAKRKLNEGLRSWLKPQLPCLVSPVIGGHMALFISAPNRHSGYSHRVESTEWGERISRYAEERFGLTLSIGIGSLQQGVEGLRRSYHEAAFAASGGGSVRLPIRHYEDVRQTGLQAAVTWEDEKQLLDDILREDQAAAQSRLSFLFERIREASAGDLDRCRNEVAGLFISITRQVKVSSPAEVLSFFQEAAEPEQLRQLAYMQVGRMLSLMGEERESRHFRVLDRAKAYIQEHYRRDISMEQAAEHVNLSPYYFSKLFKEQTGETFIDYVTGLRIERAKKLIGQEELSLKEICYEVGYKDPNYFSRVFKKITGLTPSEYRQR